HYRRELLGHLARTISGGKDTYPMAEIEVRDVPEQTLLTEQKYVNAAQLPEWIAMAGMRQLKAAADIGGQVGPSLVIYHGEVNEDSDGPVEAGLPVAAERADETSLPTRIEPAHREAYVTITRAQVRYPDILSAYDAIERWIAAHNEQIAGSPARSTSPTPPAGTTTNSSPTSPFPSWPRPQRTERHDHRARGHTGSRRRARLMWKRPTEGDRARLHDCALRPAGARVSGDTQQRCAL